MDKLYIRDWLNEDRGLALIEIAANFGEEKNRDYIEADVTIGDCNRQINLEFWCDNEETYEKRLKKVRKLIFYLQQLEHFMVNNPIKNKS